MKDTRPAEREVLLSMLPQYVEHLERNTRTLLTRFVGLIDLKVGDKVTSVLVMTSVVACVLFSSHLLTACSSICSSI